MTVTPKMQAIIDRAKRPGATYEELVDASGYAARHYAAVAIRKLLKTKRLRRSLSQRSIVAYEAR